MTAYIQLSIALNVNAEIIVPNVASVQHQEQQQKRSSRLLQQNRKKQHLRAHNIIPQWQGASSWQGSGASWLANNDNMNSKSNKSKSGKSKSNKSAKSVNKSNEQQHDIIIIESVPTTKPTSMSMTTLSPSSSEQHQLIDDSSNGILTCDEPMQLFQICTFSSSDFELKSEKCFGNGSPEVPGCYAEALSTSYTCDDLCTMMDECAMDECNFIGCEKEVSFNCRSLDIDILFLRYLLIMHPSTPLCLALNVLLS